ncbi:MAG: TonB-dependent receptor [Acidobacteriota bacterium]
MKKVKLFLTPLLGLLLISGFLLAQQDKGNLRGVVTDTEGMPLPGVSVEAKGSTGTISTLTDNNGVYRLLALFPGEYTVTFRLEGFKPVVRRGIIVRVEETLTLDISMEMGGLEEEVTVIGKSPLVDVKSTTKGMTLNKQMFEMLPKGRNFDTLVTAIPGVNSEPYLSGISVDGASGAENMYYIDGMDITNMYGGTRGQSAAFEFVEEVQIKASGYQAEFGGSMGGVVNVITRSGGNEFHGELIGYYSGSKLTTKERDTLRLNPEDVSIAEYVNYEDLYGKDAIDRWEAGFSLGGYIVKDRLWFYGSFLPTFRKTVRHIDWHGYDREGDYEENQTWWNGQLKLTAQPLEELRLSGTFVNNFYKYRGDLPSRDGVGNPDFPWDEKGFDYPNYTATVAADYLVGNNFMVSARGGYFHQNTTNQQLKPPDVPRWRFVKEAPGYAYTNNLMFPEIPEHLQHGSGWYNIGYYDMFETNKDIQNRLSANLDFTYYMDLGGEHAWKAGINMVRIEQDVDDTIKEIYVMLGWDRSFVHLDTGEEVRGEYGYYAVRGGESGPYGTFANPHSYRWAIYLQDSFTPNFLQNRLTLNVGVRAEKEDIPSFSDLPEYQYPPIEFNFTDKIAPRIGFIYDVFGDATTKVFGSFAYYYDVMKLNMALGSYGGFKWISDYYTLDDYDFTKITKDNPGGAGTYIRSYNWREPSFDTTDPNLKPMAQTEFSLGAERELRENLSASVRFVYKHLIRTIEDVGVLTAGGEQYFTGNPGYGWTLPESQGGKFDDMYPACPEAKREYYAVNINVDKRFSNNWLAGFSYTWSRLYGNYSGLASSDEWGRNSPNVERYWDLWWHNIDKNGGYIEGLLNTDRPHQFKFYGSYRFDWGLTVGLVANGMSGIPITRELHTGLEGYYPDGRATDGRTPFLFYADFYAEYNLKVTDRYRIQLNLNVDNVLDTKSARRIYGLMNQTSVILTDEERLQGWDYDDTANTVTSYLRTRSYMPDPRFLKEMAFFPPLEARFGIKFLF